MKPNERKLKMTSKEQAEFEYRTTLRYAVRILSGMHGKLNFKEVEQRKALEFVIDKLEKGIERSTKKTLALNVNV